MLLSCPKCHSIYEIPDNLIGKTGKNFRCQACANVWHAMQEDALGYEKEELTAPFIEPIELKGNNARTYPADKKDFIIPADTKSGKKTRSSTELIKQEGVMPAPELPLNKTKEITLTSDSGTSFTISTIPQYEEDKKENKEERRTPHLFEDNELKENADIRISAKDRLLPEKAGKSSHKNAILLILAALCLCLFFLRREIVSFYPEAERYYNKISLTGLNNPEYLKFGNIKITPSADKKTLAVTAEIINNSHFITTIPDIAVNNKKVNYKIATKRLLKHQKTTLEMTLPNENAPQSLTLGFIKP